MIPLYNYTFKNSTSTLKRSAAHRRIGSLGTDRGVLSAVLDFATGPYDLADTGGEYESHRRSQKKALKLPISQGLGNNFNKIWQKGCSLYLMLKRTPTASTITKRKPDSWEFELNL